MNSFSIIFLLLFSFMMKPNTPLIVAHRGASSEAPENTVPAFELGWTQGADAIEGDFYLTKDGHIVCIHDSNTKRVSNKNLEIKESTLEELRKLDVGIWKDEKYKGTLIPTIEEVFATVPKKKKIYVEIKCGPEIIPALLKEIKKSKLKKKQIVVISFNKEVIRALKKATKKYKANWLCSIRQDAASNIKPSLSSVLNTLEDINADGLSSSSRGIDKNYISSILSNNYEYHVWTVDEPEIAKNFMDWGALSITTNKPGMIIKDLGLQK
jgi:glycerophosphoryl diester phosphodiesterase